ncbi:MAG: phosphonate C-P lyase system protein PhnG [Oceanidesulfovibrio sp.]
MLQKSNDTPRNDRSAWARALAAVPDDRLREVVDALLTRYRVAHRALPEEGLAMLTLRDGAHGEPFHLGEFPLARAHVTLQDDTGARYEGGAIVMRDNADTALRLAMCDAVLAAKLPESGLVRELVDEGAALLRQEERRRQAMRERTRVDFSMLSTGRGDDDVD